jgi:hypothetical protein
VEADIVGRRGEEVQVERVEGWQSPKGVVAMLLGAGAGREDSLGGSWWEWGSGGVSLLLIGVYIYIYIYIYVYIHISIYI